MDLSMDWRIRKHRENALFHTGKGLRIAGIARCTLYRI